jgi:hypothetical protein
VDSIDWRSFKCMNFWWRILFVLKFRKRHCKTVSCSIISFIVRFFDELFCFNSINYSMFRSFLLPSMKQLRFRIESFFPWSKFISKSNIVESLSRFLAFSIIRILVSYHKNGLFIRMLVRDILTEFHKPLKRALNYRDFMVVWAPQAIQREQTARAVILQFWFFAKIVSVNVLLTNRWDFVVFYISLFDYLKR